MHPEEIKAALRKQGVTLAALADELRVSKSMVTHVVNGQAQSNRIASHIADLLDKPVATLWPSKLQRPSLRRTREQIAAQRAAAAAAA